MTDENEGVRKDGLSSSATATNAVSVEALAVTTGRTFVLTDIIVNTPAARVEAEVYDDTATTSLTAANIKMQVTAPAVITNIENGPEFATGVCVALTQTANLNTGAVWVGGIER
ncbi:hypothetical protein LCGC14_2921240 [marine sediment metagenome]|uniref:Uncharacterized protein n=1 Tax=marine sediment metagenome TaxID=412755 RepID=A0A0F8YAI8_9ZZZZ